jgi:hypothetical protein
MVSPLQIPPAGFYQHGDFWKNVFWPGCDGAWGRLLVLQCLLVKKSSLSSVGSAWCSEGAQTCPVTSRSIAVHWDPLTSQKAIPHLYSLHHILAQLHCPQQAPGSVWPRALCMPFSALNIYHAPCLTSSLAFNLHVTSSETSVPNLHLLDMPIAPLLFLLDTCAGW